MKQQYYSLNVIKKEQARMQERACRPDLYGRRIPVPGRERALSALVYNERNVHPGYLIVEVHGGGFMYNTAADDDDLCHEIHSRLGVPVVSCDYSLSPEFPFPAGLHDVYDCVKYVISLPELRAEKNKIILWGHSAGANLAAEAAYLAVNGKDFLPCMQILDYPYMDVYRRAEERAPIRYSVSGRLMDTFAHYYTEEWEDLKQPLISPIRANDSYFTGLPETFLLLCGRDNLNMGGKIYGKKLRKAGVPVTFYYVRDALHGFIENHFNYQHLPPLTKLQVTDRQHRLAEESLDHICSWIRERL